MAFSNVTSLTPRVLILGHSFVRRHKQFIAIQAYQNTDFALDFKVSDVCTVCMLGIGGQIGLTGPPHYSGYGSRYSYSRAWFE